MRLSRHVSLAGWCLFLVIQGCVSPSPKPGLMVDYDHSYDFGHVRKIAIQPIARDSLETMLISDQQIRRINGALVEELLRRDFVVVADNNDADMYLVWRFIHEDSGTSLPLGPGGEQPVEGTLYVNMIDPLVLQDEWRATFRADLRDRPETPEAAQYRRNAAKAILAQFPPP